MAATKILRPSLRLPDAAYVATTYLFDTLDWLNPWHEPIWMQEMEEEFHYPDGHQHLFLHNHPW